jgi:hypothetical protein
MEVGCTQERRKDALRVMGNLAMEFEIVMIPTPTKKPAKAIVLSKDMLARGLAKVMMAPESQAEDSSEFLYLVTVGITTEKFYCHPPVSHSK